MGNCCCRPTKAIIEIDGNKLDCETSCISSCCIKNNTIKPDKLLGAQNKRKFFSNNSI